MTVLPPILFLCAPFFVVFMDPNTPFLSSAAFEDSVFAYDIFSYLGFSCNDDLTIEYLPHAWNCRVDGFRNSGESFSGDVSMDYASFIMGDDLQPDVHETSEPDFATSAESSVAATPSDFIQSNDDYPVSIDTEHLKFSQEIVLPSIRC